MFRNSNVNMRVPSLVPDDVQRLALSSHSLLYLMSYLKLLRLIRRMHDLYWYLILPRFPWSGCHVHGLSAVSINLKNISKGPKYNGGVKILQLRHALCSQHVCLSCHICCPESFSPRLHLHARGKGNHYQFQIY